MYFTPKQRENLNKMGSLIDEAFEIMVKNLNNADYASVTKDEAKQKEKEINAFRDTLREEHLSNLGNDDYNVKAAMIYNNVFHAMERVGDHIINVTEAVIGEI